MRSLAIVLALTALAGCASGPPPVTVPTIMTKEVDRYVPLDARLLKQWPIDMPVDGTWGEAPIIAAKRGANLEKCNAQLGEIAKTQPIQP